MTGKPQWKQFEELVAAIEEAAAPRGAVVTRDDRIPDLITGEMRQVDATVRFRAGSTDILILIECRNRQDIEDVRWVEEMVMKLRGLAASKIILVSSSGFTSPAKAKAKHYGVELRELAEIDAEKIQDWFLPHDIVHLFRLIDDTKCHVVLTEEPDKRIEVDANEPRFLHRLVHTPFPAVAFLNFIEMNDPIRFWAVPLDGSKTPMTIELDGTAPDLIPVPLGVPKPKDSVLELLRDDTRHRVERLSLSFQISYETATFNPKDGIHHMYGAPEGAKIQHSRFQGRVFDLPVTFEHQSDDGGQSATVQFPSGLKLPSMWAGLLKQIRADKDNDEKA